MTYIATFFSHFGAIRYKKLCEQAGYAAKTMPVPRTLSSSCGTCVRYEAPDPCLERMDRDMECVYREDGENFTRVHRGE